MVVPAKEDERLDVVPEHGDKTSNAGYSLSLREESREGRVCEQWDICIGFGRPKRSNDRANGV